MPRPRRPPPASQAFIEPDLKAAQLRVHNPFNPFSGFMSPTYILKSAAPVTPAAIAAVLGPAAARKSEQETYDIYLVPPGEDPETCQSWLRMRCRDGRYNLMFEEWVVEGVFIISPRVTFEVPVRILGGLMALGYEIGTIMQRTSESYSANGLTAKVDHILGMDRSFVQVQGKDRAAVAAAGAALGLDGTYIPHSYIELVQLENLTQSFQTVTEDLKRRFAVNGEPLVDEQTVGSYSRGSSPLPPSFTRTLGFAADSPKGAALMSRSAPTWVKVTTPPSAARHASLLSHGMQRVASAAGGAAALEAGGMYINGHGPAGGSGGQRSTGSSTPDGAGRSGSRPASPAASGEQVRRLIASQAALTSQMEELALQLGHSQRAQEEQQQRLAGGAAPPEWARPLAWASAGAAAGALAALLWAHPSAAR
jgi:adenylate cyclase class IV